MAGGGKGHRAGGFPAYLRSPADTHFGSIRPGDRDPRAPAERHNAALQKQTRITVSAGSISRGGGSAGRSGTQESNQSSDPFDTPITPPLEFTATANTTTDVTVGLASDIGLLDVELLCNRTISGLLHTFSLTLKAWHDGTTAWRTWRTNTDKGADNTTPTPINAGITAVTFSVSGGDLILHITVNNTGGNIAARGYMRVTEAF